MIQATLRLSELTVLLLEPVKQLGKTCIQNCTVAEWA